MARRGMYRRRGGKRGKRSVGRYVFAGFTAALFVALAGAAAYGFHEFVRNSTSFRVKHVLIEGTLVLDQDAVLAHSGITAADNVLFFDKAGTRERVEAMPYVKHCRVEVIFPDTVALYVQERTALATLMVNSRSYAMDPQCIILSEYGVAEMPEAPFVTNVAGLEFVEVGEQLTHPALQAAVAVWQAFSETPLAAELSVSELSALHEDDIRMYCDKVPFEFRWGRAGLAGREHFALQARRLEVLWRNKDGSLPCKEYLDLRFDENLVCK